jgi:hypothetical protein
VAAKGVCSTDGNSEISPVMERCANQAISGANADYNSNNFVFGSVQGKFQVFCNFAGTADPSSVASTVATIVSNLKDNEGDQICILPFWYTFIFIFMVSSTC